MGKIRVQDLAKMMGISNQDLIFKLKSIGVRVDGEDAHIDTDIIQAILEGKKLPHPREVILRDEPAPEEPSRSRRLPHRRLTVNPLRPSRPRTMIQKVEPKIHTLPGGAKPAPDRRPSAPASGEPRGARAAASRSAEAAVEPAKTPAPTPPTTAAEPTRPEKRRVEEERELGRQEKRTKRGKKVARPVEAEEDLKSYRGSLREIEAVVEEEDQAPPVISARRRRRVERKQEAREKEEEGKILTFKKAPPTGPVTLTEGMTVREFAEKLGVKAKDLIKALFDRGILANINHVLDLELAQQLAADLGVETMVVSFEEEVQLEQETEAEGEGRVPRAPVVTIMGHVDHGKTSLLDAIRSSKITETEHGGITQHIGAYQVEADGRKIVFLDTPGHEAFTLMRARGAQVTDIVILVVAADDGVMPQTVEAINHARAAKVPIVVAINKIDKPNANPDRVKKELAEEGLSPEEWGGNTVMVPISATRKEGISELLEMVLLTADLLELTAHPDLPAQGTIVEAKKEAGRGIVATVLVQNGTLRVGDIFVAGATWGRVRAMVTDRGERVTTAGSATPVEVMGFQDLPEAGDRFQVVEDEARARNIAQFRQEEQRRRELAPPPAKLSLEQLFDKIEKGEVKELPVILKADVQGSLEVLRETLNKLSTDKVKVQVIHSGVGAISTNDVLLASASEAIVIGFNVRPERNAAELAEKENVEVRLHTVIYELTDELKKAMAGLLEPTYREVAKGRAEVREIFRIPKVGTVAGCHVVEGIIPRNAQVRLVRDGQVVYEGRIASLKRFKEDVTEVRSGFDCGVGLERFQDVKPGDIIEAYVREEVQPVL